MSQTTNWKPKRKRNELRSLEDRHPHAGGRHLGRSAPGAGARLALAGPERLPRPVVDRLNAELRKALAVPAVSNGLQAIGDLRPTTPEEMRDRVASELATWIRIVDEAKIPKQ